LAQNYRAKFNCPGCGSPLEISEGTISLRCSFCGMIMRIGAPGRILKYFYESDLDDFALKFSLEKHLKASGLELSFKPHRKKLYYLPFYRFRGTTYTLLKERVMEESDEIDSETPPPVKVSFYQKCRNLDLTIPGFTDNIFGLDSLGVRPEVMPLTVYIGDNMPSDSVLLDIVSAPKDARQQALGLFAFNLGISLESKECLISEMVGEWLSVIYYPVWAYSVLSRAGETTYFLDGLSKRILNTHVGSIDVVAKGVDKSQSSTFQPVAHKCPNCGFDLLVSETAIVYYCSNCNRSFLIQDTSYLQIPTRSGICDPGGAHFPFWKFAISITKGQKTVGEFAKLLTGEIPLIARNKAQNQFYLYIPAFKFPELDMLTNRGLRLCRTQPIIEYGNDSITPGAEPILPQGEALELARFYWFVLRSKYRHLLDPSYDIKAANNPEFVWLTLTDFTAINRGKVANYA
jgi:LSD1 subclass zinc finger protein